MNYINLHGFEEGFNWIWTNVRSKINWLELLEGKDHESLEGEKLKNLQLDFDDGRGVAISHYERGKIFFFWEKREEEF